MWKPDWKRRDRTHLYVVPQSKFQEQEFLTYQLIPSAAIVDWRQEFLAAARPSQKRLGISVETEIRRLQTICNSAQKVFSVINTEYLLAHFTERMREQFWLALWSSFPNLTGILVFTVLDAPAILPDNYSLENWRREERLFSVSETS